MTSSTSITARQLLNSIITREPLRTGHLALDQTLGPNHHQLIQVEGPPGSGKTKLVLGIAIRARATSLTTPHPTEVLLIDADASLHPALIRQSACSLIQSQPFLSYPDQSKLLDQICDGLHLVRITSTAELGLFLRNLSRWLPSHPKVKLVILDSITSHTRYVSMAIGQRKTISKIIRDSLTATFLQHDCGVIVTSQLTAKVVGGHPDARAHCRLLVPPDFPFPWHKPHQTPSAGLKTQAHPHKKLRIPNPPLLRICLAFRPDRSRIASVLENHRLLDPRSGCLFDINDIGIFDPSPPPTNTPT